MNSQRLNERILVIGFFVLLLMPMLGMVFPIERPGVLVENRPLAEAPAWRDVDLARLSEARKQLERFLNDRFGWRTTLIKLNNGLRYFMFGISASEQVTTGREGWLFYTKAVDDFRAPRATPPSSLQKTVDHISRRRTWLASRGIEYYIFLAPNKAGQYREYLPEHLSNRENPAVLDQLNGYAKTQGAALDIVDPRGRLLAAKSAHPTYERTDTHWNDWGAYVGYSALMERIRIDHPGLISFRAEPGDFEEVRDEGRDLARMLGIAEWFDEETSIRYRHCERFEARNQSTDHLPYERARVTRARHGAPLKLVMFCDSFGYRKAFRSYLAEGFSESVILMEGSDFFDANLIEREKPDIVIQEVVERHLVGAFRSSPNPPLQSGARKENMLANLVPKGKTRIRLQSGRGGEWLVVESAGKDPVLILPPLQLEEGGKYSLHVDMQSPAPTRAKVYYMTAGESHYCESEKVSKDIPAGRQQLVFELPKVRIENSLRFDPGEIPGRFVIHRIDLVLLDEP